jgi:glycosyltransferase involved in cell wall biosynthesis
LEGNKELTLRIGIIGSDQVHSGGAFTAEASMRAQLTKALPLAHFEIFDLGRASVISKSRFLKGVYRLEFAIALATQSPIFWRLNTKFQKLLLTRFEKDLLRKKFDLIIYIGNFETSVMLKKIPYVITIWDLGHLQFPSLPEVSQSSNFEYRDWLVSFLGKKAFAIITDSKTTNQALVNNYNFELSKLVELPYFLSVKETLKDIQRGTEAFYPAHFWSHKNHRVLLEAMHVLIKSGRTSRRLILTGLDKGNLDFVIKTAEDLGVSHLIDYRGFIEREELDEIYRSSAVTVYPSILGPTNIPPLESLLHGCPVFISKSISGEFLGYPGVGFVEDFSAEEWSQVMDISLELPVVNVDAVNQIQEAILKSNISKIGQLIDQFTAFRKLHA